MLKVLVYISYFRLYDRDFYSLDFRKTDMTNEFKEVVKEVGLLNTKM